MKKATLTISISQEKAMFNPSNEVKEHYTVTFKYRKESALNKRVFEYTSTETFDHIAKVVVYNLSK